MLAAMDAVMSGRGSEPFVLNDGTVFDLEAAVRASPFARTTLADKTLSEELKQTAVRFAIMQALDPRYAVRR